MLCLDCDAAGERVPAIGVCRDCGAGVCAEHARLWTQALTCTKPIARIVTVSPPLRRIACTACAAAHGAYAECCPSSVSRIPAS